LVTAPSRRSDGVDRAPERFVRSAARFEMRKFESWPRDRESGQIPILICRGLNPTAPASQSVSNASHMEVAQQPRGTARFRRYELVSVCGIWQAGDQISSPLRRSLRWRHRRTQPVGSSNAATAVTSIWSNGPSPMCPLLRLDRRYVPDKLDRPASSKRWWAADPHKFAALGRGVFVPGSPRPFSS